MAVSIFSSIKGLALIFTFVVLAMVADRAVLLPGTTLGRCTVMGSGALGKRDTTYEDGSTWIGNGMVLSYIISLN